MRRDAARDVPAAGCRGVFVMGKKTRRTPRWEKGLLWLAQPRIRQLGGWAVAPDEGVELVEHERRACGEAGPREAGL